MLDSVVVADRERKKTLEDLKLKLEKHGKCCVVRGMGFGKTTMVSRLAMSYRRVLFMFPAKIVRMVVDDAIQTLEGSDDEYGVCSGQDEYVIEDGSIRTPDGVLNSDNSSEIVYRTYQMLSMDVLEDEPKLDWFGFDLIVADECHRLGARKAMPAMHRLLKWNPNAHFVGLSGTINRTDGVDVVSELFDGIKVYNYDLHDMFEDGMLKKPYYFYGTYDIESSIRNEAVRLGIDVDEERVSAIKQSILNNSNIKNGADIIKYCVDGYADQTSYIKFIVFYNCVSSIDSKVGEVEKWFMDSFPSHSLSSIIVHSKDSDSRDLSRLYRLKPAKNTIHLIHCVNMLTVGYHPEYLTGIIMLRGTQSSIVYNQQYCRAVGTSYNSGRIIIDLVDNLHRKSLLEHKSYNKNVLIVRLRNKIKSLAAEIQYYTIREDYGRCVQLRRQMANVKSKLAKLEMENLESGAVSTYVKDVYQGSISGYDLIAISNIASEREVYEKLLEGISSDCETVLIKYATDLSRLIGKPLKSTSVKSIVSFLKKQGITEDRLNASNKEYMRKSNRVSLRDLPLRSYCDTFNVGFQAMMEYMRKVGVFG